MNAKQLVGEKAAEYVKEGMTVGLGTGSTAYWAVMKIGEMVRGGLKIKAVPTSLATEKLAIEQQIPLVDINEITSLDITIDGADEFDQYKDLIKGGGGALLREKVVASITKFYIVIADESKKSKTLGSFALPVEVTPFAKELTRYQLEQLGCQASFRQKDGVLFITDNQNYIADCKFDAITNPGELSTKINQLPGVVENGLFCKTADLIICNNQDGNIELI